MVDYLIPILLIVIFCVGLSRKYDSYTIMLRGTEDGLKIIIQLIPILIVLMTMVSMLRASGALEILSRYLAPVFHLFGIPPETCLLVLIRPFSGSAALAIGTELMAEYGPDSPIGRTAAVMLGSTETTFYTISVYFGAAGIKKTRYAIPAALVADLTGFIVASLTAKFL